MRRGLLFVSSGQRCAAEQVLKRYRTFVTSQGIRAVESTGTHRDGLYTCSIEWLSRRRPRREKSARTAVVGHGRSPRDARVQAASQLLQEHSVSLPSIPAQSAGTGGIRRAAAAGNISECLKQFYGLRNTLERGSWNSVAPTVAAAVASGGTQATVCRFLSTLQAAHDSGNKLDCQTWERVVEALSLSAELASDHLQTLQALSPQPDLYKRIRLLQCAERNAALAKAVEGSHEVTEIVMQCVESVSPYIRLKTVVASGSELDAAAIRAGDVVLLGGAGTRTLASVRRVKVTPGVDETGLQYQAVACTVRILTHRNPVLEGDRIPVNFLECEVTHRRAVVAVQSVFGIWREPLCPAMRSILLGKEPPVTQAQLLPGDWVCDSCGAFVFARRATCLDCGASHDAAAGSKAPNPLPATLTDRQRAVVDAALQRAVVLVHGPPGTGKTRTACAVIAAWRSSAPGKILAVTDSNVAADNLHHALEKHGIRSTRFFSGVVDGSGVVRGEVARRVADAEASGHRLLAEKLRRGVTSEALARSQIVVCTCAAAGHPALDPSRFTRVVVDEATQAMAGNAIIALAKGAKQIVALGDPQQLPPTIISTYGRSRPAREVSFFEVLRETAAIPAILLSEQRRMHPLISEFPNQHFYGGCVADSRCALERLPLSSTLGCRGARVVFVESSSQEQEIGTSFLNRGQTEIVLGLLRRLSDQGLKASNVAVITPYRAHRDHLVASISATAGDLSAASVDTIDGFQGQEREVVLLCTTRSGTGVGFLSDRRRLNVALTRARSLLCVVGHRQTLERDPDWGAWINWASVRATVWRSLPWK
mmetsp:Transcript_34853/g.91043  ORF Transcript_34853/g.91043 Transcript_34853/m.91043 type:complete len:822 (+) Transcript_34853:1002-3467(+)